MSPSTFFFSVLLFISLLSLSFAQYVDPVTTTALSGLYGGNCVTTTESVGSISELEVSNFSSSTFHTQIVITIGSTCSTADVTIDFTGTYSLGGTSVGVSDATDIDLSYTTKTLIFTNQFVPLLLGYLVNSMNQTCFPGSSGWKMNTVYDLSNISCDTLGLYPCNPVLSIVQLQLVNNGTFISLGEGPPGGGCTTPRPTEFGPSMFSDTSPSLTTTTTTGTSTTGGAGTTTTGNQGTTTTGGTTTGNSYSSGGRLFSWIGLF